jgi:hypothetical protein
MFFENRMAGRELKSVQGKNEYRLPSPIYPAATSLLRIFYPHKL